MPKQIITSSSAATTGFTPGGVSLAARAGDRFGNMLFVSGNASLDPVTCAPESFKKQLQDGLRELG
jgi:hypothetical protein